ncbi:MAG: KamA family radical SAM protein [Oligoflexia bacterium]|nr:KamA family radical SAM protein [Oligoflexia bacterium]MBF0367096.1 KamA family radical SAM protein [Oligoflexia bacterium]
MHNELKSGEFWREIPGFSSISEETFLDPNWQLHHAITSIPMAEAALKGRDIPPAVFADLAKAQQVVPMNIRITPYIFSLMNWKDPQKDPLRRMFFPMFSQLILENHAMTLSDSLSEDEDSPASQLTHRYPDKALFLALAICPTYCSYCTRARLIGGSTQTVQKKTAAFAPKAGKWESAFNYIQETKSLEDIVISGGDVSLLSAEDIYYIGTKLLSIPHIRRIRYATKSIIVNPMKILNDNDWVDAIFRVRDFGLPLDKSVVIHTHSSHPSELTEITQRAMRRLFRERLIVRNQGVLLNQVNNSAENLTLHVRRLSYLNIQPYYFYQHDMVPGCEHLRTPLHETIMLEKAVRGSTAGFNTPNFVCDLPRGGGKRHVATYEKYDRLTGISMWQAPAVKNKIFFYFDPLHSLSAEGQRLWRETDAQSLIEQTMGVAYA